ncbi:MAG: hypothetical protein P1S60_15520 [Anaerolineae bacterium]|nr:hypothetical protein [Anaerolineae bacterium]
MVIVLALTWQLTNAILYPVTHTPEETLAYEIEQGCLSRRTFDGLPKQTDCIAGVPLRLSTSWALFTQHPSGQNSYYLPWNHPECGSFVTLYGAFF